jgi:Zn-dependent metalloprotease
MSSVKEVTPNGWIKYNKDSKITAENIFKVHKNKMGLTDGDEIKLVSQEADKTFRMHLKYKQFFKGIPIEGTDYTLHLVKGQLDLSHGRLVEDVDFDIKEKVDEKKALELALKSINTKVFAWEKKEWEDKLKELKGDKKATFLPVGEKVITKKNKDVFTKDNFALAWKFLIETAEPKNTYEVYVDANTGEVITSRETKMECFASAESKTIKAKEPSNQEPNVFDIYLKQLSKQKNINSTLSSPYCWGHNGNFIPLYARYSGGTFGYLPFVTNKRGFPYYDYTLEDCRIHTKPWDSFWWFDVAGNLTDDENTWDGSSSSTYRSVTTAHWAFQKSWDYFDNTFGRWGSNNNGKKVHAWANNTSFNNAAFTGTNIFADNFVIGTGADGVSGSYAVLDVIGHEYTHAITKNVSNLNYERESGALNESFSDIFGVMIERSVLGSYNWLYAEDCNPVGNANRRDLTMNAVYRGLNWLNIDDCTPNPYNDFCVIHTNLSVQNKFFSLLADGGSQPAGPGTFVSGIGIDNAARIGYRALTNYIHSNSNYADSREAWMNAARDLFGECSEQRKQVANAWSAVGIGNPLTCTPSNSCNFANGDYMFNWYGENVYAHKCGDKYYCTTDAGTGGYFKPRHWLEATGYANANCFEENDPRPNCTSTGGGGSCTFAEGQYIFTFGATGEVVLAYTCGGILYAKTTENLFKPRHWLIAAGYDATLAQCFAENNPGCGANGRVSADNSTTNIQEIEGFKFEIYPNPTSDNVKVKFYLEENGKVKLNLWDSRGVLITNSEFEGIKGENIKTIELNSAQSGMYFIELQNGNKSSTQKIVKIQ